MQYNAAPISAHLLLIVMSSRMLPVVLKKKGTCRLSIALYHQKRSATPEANPITLSPGHSCHVSEYSTRYQYFSICYRPHGSCSDFGSEFKYEPKANLFYALRIRNADPMLARDPLQRKFGSEKLLPTVVSQTQSDVYWPILVEMPLPVRIDRT